MVSLSELINEFTHEAPSGTHYEIEKFKSNVFSIWLHYDCKFDYNLGKPVKCIWGFYNTKECKFYSPVNSKTIGKSVNFENTRNYTAMPLLQTPLEAAFT